MKSNTSDALKAKIIWWLGLVMGAVALYLRVFLSDLPAWASLDNGLSLWQLLCCVLVWDRGAPRGTAANTIGY